MDNNKIVIGLLIVIVAILLAGIVLLSSNHDKVESKVIVISNATLYEGDSFSIKLTDVNNSGIANQKVNITFNYNNGSEYKEIVTTNNDGDASLKLNNLTSNNYTVTVNYGGNDNYTGCNATQKIEIKEKVVSQEQTTSSSNSDARDDGYWETSPDADFEYHTEYYSDGEFRQYDRAGRLVGSSYDEDQEKVADNVGRRI